MSETSLKNERFEFLKLAFQFQGGMTAVALLLGWMTGHPPWQRMQFTLAAFGWGVAATIPMVAFLAITYRSRLPSLVRIRELLHDVLGKPLAACGWLDLCVVAVLAGVSEEFLFRGVLQGWLSGWGWIAGLILTNILFGLCHAITPLYTVLAALLGVYLSMTFWLIDPPNLVIPICCHSLYDLIAFVVVRREYRLRQTQLRQDTKGSGPTTDMPDAPDSQQTA